MKETINYIKKLISIDSPTGFTREISTYLIEEIEKLGYKAIRGNKGGVNVVVEGKMIKNIELLLRMLIRLVQ